MAKSMRKHFLYNIAPSKEKKEFVIQITHFKGNGAFQDYSEVVKKFRTVENSQSAYMPDVTSYVRELFNSKEKWNGFLLVDCEEGYPCLLVGKEPKPLIDSSERSLRAE